MSLYEQGMAVIEEARRQGHTISREGGAHWQASLLIRRLYFQESIVDEAFIPDGLDEINIKPQEVPTGFNYCGLWAVLMNRIPKGEARLFACDGTCVGKLVVYQPEE